MISQSGDFIFDVALLWLVLELTHSAFYTGVTVAAELAPLALIAPVAGVYVDRFDRRRLLGGAFVAQGLLVGALAALYVLHALTLPEILVIVFGLNAAATIPRVTVPAMLPRLVSADDLFTANSLYSFSSSTNQLASLSLGGALIAALGVGIPILYDAATFFLAAVLLLFVARAYLAAPAGAVGMSPAATGPSFGQRLAEGWRHVRSDRVLSQLMLTGLVVNIFGGILLALLAPYAAQTLGGNAATYGLLLASLAVGTLVGALLLGAIRTREHVGPLLFVGIAAVGAALVPLGLERTALLALPTAFVLGLGLATANVPISTLFQVRTPDHLRARSLALLFAVLVSPQPVGSILGGLLTHWLSVGAVLVVCGLAILAITGVAAVAFGELRRVRY